MGRAAHDVIIRLGEVAAVLILVVGFVLWRLTQGPVELDRLVPYVQQVFDQSGEPLRVAISGVSFGFDRYTHQLDLWVKGVRVSLPDGKPVARFPQVATSFSLGSLLRGRLAPTRLVVERPLLRLERDKTGAVSLQLGGQNGAASGLGAEALDAMMRPPQPASPFDMLRRVAVRDATIIFDDRRSGRQWRASRVDAAMLRRADGLDGDLSFALALGAGPSEVHANYRYSAARQRIDLRLAVYGLQPAALAALSPELKPLSLAQFPVTGTIRTRIDLASDQWQGFRADLDFGRGLIRSILLPNGVLPLDGGELRAVYAPDEKRLRLDKLTFSLGGGSQVTFGGSLDGLTPAQIGGTAALPPELAGKLGVTLSNVPVAKFESLWPRALSPGGRRWVLANIHEGVLDSAAVRLDLRVETAARTAQVVGAHGSMRYHDLTIDYLRGLPPVTQVAGTAKLADKELDFFPTRGTLKGLRVKGGTLRITDLGAAVEWLTIDLGLSGPLQEALKVIDTPPLRYAHAIGVNPQAVDGQIAADLHFKLPLLEELKLADVDYAAKARLTGVGFAKAALDRDLSHGGFSLNIGRTSARLGGTARLAGVPADIDAKVFFNPGRGPRARYRVVATLDDAARRRLGCDFLPRRLSGPVKVNVAYSAFEDKRAEALVRLDLRPAALSVAEAGWKKPRSVPASATVALSLVDNKVVGLPRIEIAAPGFDGHLSMTLAADSGRIERVELQHVAIGPDDVSGFVEHQKQGGWRVVLNGPRFDLGQFLKVSKADRATPSALPLVINARLGQVVIGPGRDIRNLSAELLRKGGVWQAARVEGQYSNGHRLTLRFGRDPGSGGLIFLSDDLGATLRLLDIANDIAGGKVTVKGQFSDVSGTSVFHGKVEGEGYRVTHAPVFARLLSLASLTGLANMLAGAGIPFSTLRADVTYANGHLAVENLLAYGESLGITANGSYDLASDQLAVQGTVVPAYLFNSMLGHVPVIGSLLLGGKGEGVFAANYRVTGSGGDPQVSVNPLSAFAPGFLRQLFQPWGGRQPTTAGASPQGR